MNTYIISYDLRNPGENYEQLVKLIKSSFSYWARLGNSAYAICTSESAVNVRDNLSSVLFADDKLYVGKIASPAAWTGLGDDVSQWLRNYL